MLSVRIAILADTPSPSEDMQSCMEYLEFRVKRLSKATGGDIDLLRDKINEAQEIERLWYLAEAVSEPQASALEERFEKSRILSDLTHYKRKWNLEVTTSK